METTYGEDLDKIKVELAHRRSEMANLATQTINDLEPKIPALQANINTLTSEVTRLDTLIATKTKQSEYDENYWRKHYADLESSLNKAHDARTATIKEKDDQYDVKDKEYADKEEEFKLREKYLEDELKKLSESRNSLNLIYENFEKEKSSHEDKVRKIMSDLNGHINETNAEKLNQKELTKRLEEQSGDLAIKVKEAEATIDRINEAQSKLDKAQVKEDNVIKAQIELTAREEVINESHVRSKANMQRDSERADALDQREKKCSEREKNIKLAESVIAKKG